MKESGTSKSIEKFLTRRRCDFCYILFKSSSMILWYNGVRGPDEIFPSTFERS